MRNRQEWKQRVQEEKENLEDYEVFESADYRTMLHSIAYEITAGTLKTVDARSGFCTYPMVAFDLKRLAELDPEGTKQFAQQVGIELG